MDAERRTPLGLLIGIAIGGAVMYLLDPVAGSRRRALSRERARHATGVGRRRILDAGIDRWTGVRRGLARLRGRSDEEILSDEQLVARVRARIGRTVDRIGAVQVRADGGVVTIRGEVRRHELRPLLRAARAVRGVREVRPQLRVREGTPTPA